MKKTNQSTKKLTLNRKVVILLTNKEQAHIRAGSYSVEQTVCNCRSTTPGQACPSADCTTVPTATCPKENN